jgi:two-component system, NarL family, invasion response regulator UvrY
VIRLLVADDHPVVRSGIRNLLRDAADMRVTAEATTAADVLRAVSTHQFDAILLDLSFPDGSGFEVMNALRERASKVPVVVFTNSIDAAGRSADAGASAFVSKESGIDELRRAITAAVGGRSFVAARPAREVQRISETPQQSDLPHLSLSPRELEIMLELVRGRRPKEIACDLDISEKTVATHRARLMRKLGVSDNRQLLLYALKAGLTDWS